MSSAKKSPPAKKSLVTRRASPRLAADTLVKATTVRLEPALQEGLTVLHDALKRPVNKLVNEAVQEYLDRQSERIGRDLEGLLSRLKAVRKRDPKFREAIEAFAHAESQFGKDDPVEGVVVSDEPGPAQQAVRSLLFAK